MLSASRRSQIVVSATSLWLRPLFPGPWQTQRRYTAGEHPCRIFIELFTANIRNHNSDHATLLGIFASSVFSTFTLICLVLASTFFARRILSTPKQIKVNVEKTLEAKSPSK